MKITNFKKKHIHRVLNIIVFCVFQYPRILKYKMISTSSSKSGSPKVFQPLLIYGQGSIRFANNVNFGVYKSPGFFNGYIYIEARRQKSEIKFGSNVWANNNTVFISEGEGIFIGENTIIGHNSEFYDSDFHGLDPKERMGKYAKTGKVSVGKNVFIGSNVTVLKGSSIGDNSVIANGSVVTKSIPSNVVAGGIPAKVIKSL